MTRPIFYRLALATPIIVPALALGSAYAFGSVFFLPAMVFGFSWLFTRWTYPLFAVLVLLWMRRKPIPEIERGSRWLPMIYGPLCGVEVASYYARPIGSSQWIEDFFFGVVVAVVFGYAYVGIVRFGADLLTSKATSPGTLSPATPSPPGT